MTDPIADMLTRIRNANQMRNKEVSMPVSKIKVEIAKILDAEGFITNYTVKENTLTLTLKYGQNKERVITGLKRISKPGLRVYASKDELVLKKYSPISTISTYAQAIADGINSLTEKVCLITDCDAVIYVTGNKYKEAIGKILSEQMDKILKERKSVVISKSDGGTIVPIVKGENFEAENQIVVPMIFGGDCFGAIVVFDNDKVSRFSSSDVKLVQLGANFLSAFLM